jgi:hypothetical protein
MPRVGGDLPPDLWSSTMRVGLIPSKAQTPRLPPLIQGAEPRAQRRRAAPRRPPAEASRASCAASRGCTRAASTPRATSPHGGVLCRGFFMVSCIVPSSPRRVSQETVQRTSGGLGRPCQWEPWGCVREANRAPRRVSSPAGTAPRRFLEGPVRPAQYEL